MSSPPAWDRLCPCRDSYPSLFHTLLPEAPPSKDTSCPPLTGYWDRQGRWGLAVICGHGGPGQGEHGPWEARPPPVPPPPGSQALGAQSRENPASHVLGRSSAPLVAAGCFPSLLHGSASPFSSRLRPLPGAGGPDPGSVWHLQHLLSVGVCRQDWVSCSFPTPSAHHRAPHRGGPVNAC